MFSKYGRMYFSQQTIESGSKWLLSDVGSSESFRCLLSVIADKETRIDFSSKLKSSATPKYLVAAADDILFPPELLKTDAENSDSKLLTIQNAGHFVTFDQPEAVAGLIENIVIDSIERK